MDPLSIAASVAGLTTICVAIAKTLCTVCDKLKGASQVVNSLRSEARTISFSLSQLQTILLGDADSVPSKALLDPELLSTVDIALTGCSVTLSCLEEEIRSLVGKLAREEGMSFVDRAEVGWKDDKFKELLQQLRGQYGAIALLLNGLQMKSLTDIHRLLNDNQGMIQQTASRTESLRGLFPQVHVAGSIFDVPSEVDSVFGDIARASASEKEFEFDNIVTSSQAYRRVMAAGTRRALLDVRDQQTVDEDLIDLGIVLVDVSSTVETLISTEESRHAHDLDLLITPINEEELKILQVPLSVSGSETSHSHNEEQSKEGGNHAHQATATVPIKGPREIMRERQAREAQRRVKQEKRSASERRRNEEEEGRILGGGRREIGGVAFSVERSNRETPQRNSGGSTGGQWARPMHLSQVPEELPGEFGEPDAQSATRPGESSQDAAASSRLGTQRGTDNSKGLSTSTAVAQAKEKDSSIETATRSSFPHAFERWEALSCHWEGLTSFWIRRLEENSVEIRREPLTQQLSRQITDLAAAGANLFHAVVELQRLRASSERKFQRWFFETRGEQERSQELMAMIEATLEEERKNNAKLETRCGALETDLVSSEQDLDAEIANTSRLKKRLEEAEAELRIAKTEAQRAWQELGHSQGEKTVMIERLQDGEPATIGRLTLVPMMPKSGHEGSPNTVLLCQLFWN